MHEFLKRSSVLSGRWRLPLLLAALAAAALALSACSTASDDQQQEQAQQEQQQAESAAETTSTSSSGTTTTSSSSGASTSTQRTTARSQESEQQEQQAVADTQEEMQSDEQPMQQQEDDGMGGMQAGMSVAIIEEAAYDDLSPRLQLLRDSGYPVYVSGDGFTIALGTPDLSPGRHRISVVIEGPVGLVETPAMRITVVNQDSPGEMQEVIARFSRFPDGVRGFHVTAVDFTTVGRWN